MAVSQVEEKILGRLARYAEPSNPLLAASFYQVLGLSILLSRKLYRARRLRKLDITRDTKSLQLYHQIIWLAREGLSITEVYILPYCQDGEQGPECRVMAAKIRASFYHVFCLFHNHPPVNLVSPQSGKSTSTSSSDKTAKTDNTNRPKGLFKPSPKKKTEPAEDRRRPGKPNFRDPIPSVTSDASYVTNPFAGPAQTPPPAGPPPPIPTEVRRTPSRPPGLAPINISPTRAAASFLLPPLNFVPMAREHFETAQQLATSLLTPASALRLSVSLEYTAFLWDCEKDKNRAQKLARKTIKEVYASTEGLDDDEFADASAMVQALGGIVRRGMKEAAQQSARDSPPDAVTQPPKIDRTIAVSPTKQAKSSDPVAQRDSIMRTPDRLSTVPEVESTEAISDAPTSAALSPPVSRLSNRSKHRRPSSATSDKASKRRALEHAEALHRQRSASNVSSATPSRQDTPSEGQRHQQAHDSPRGGVTKEQNVRAQPQDRREAVLKALEIISSVSRGLQGSANGHVDPGRLRAV
ncbi:hypothetical protein D0860_02988 [Hortaea werneckii]|uniref:14-3-3 domain-containing protein n=1 Tax=Hortaea werneckii TaxID=91943 RepID=A0A3M7HGN1_HORWE|nr:hypothetical protein D0860_02988 [Hortaea werneckii]